MTTNAGATYTVRFTDPAEITPGTLVFDARHARPVTVHHTITRRGEIVAISARLDNDGTVTMALAPGTPVPVITDQLDTTTAIPDTYAPGDTATLLILPTRLLSTGDRLLASNNARPLALNAHTRTPDGHHHLNLTDPTTAITARTIETPAPRRNALTTPQ